MLFFGTETLGRGDSGMDRFSVVESEADHDCGEFRIEAIPDGVVPAVEPIPICFPTRTKLYEFLASPSPASHGSRHNLAADYVDAWYMGAELVWYHDLYDCYTHNFSNGTYPSGWNDVVSSAKIFSDSGCFYFYHYVDVYFGGYAEHCNIYWCEGVDNMTSSMKLQRNP